MRSTGGTHDFIVDETRELPDNLCNDDGSVAMPMPNMHQQMVFFANNTNAIALGVHMNPNGMSNRAKVRA